MNYTQWLTFALGGILGVMAGVCLAAAWIRLERTEAQEQMQPQDALAREVDAMMGTEGRRVA
jgi:uncharacterized protein involved in exopolysaccharide biosynthesis